jgi:hypothetical protein
MDNELALAILKEIAILRVTVNRFTGKEDEFQDATGIHLSKTDQVNKEFQLLKEKLNVQ